MLLQTLRLSATNAQEIAFTGCTITLITIANLGWRLGEQRPMRGLMLLNGLALVRLVVFVLGLVSPLDVEATEYAVANVVGSLIPLWLLTLSEPLCRLLGVAIWTL